MKLEFCNIVLEKSTNIKFHKNPLIGSRVVLCGKTDGQLDTAKIIFAFFQFCKGA